MLKQSRWCFLKTPENLAAKQRVKLKDRLCYDLKRVRAYLLEGSVQGLWEFLSAKWAGRYMNGRLRGHAKPAIADQEGCPEYPRPPTVDPEPRRAQEGVLRRHRGRIGLQGQTDPNRGVRFQRAESRRSRTLSYTCTPIRAKTLPRIPLGRPFFKLPERRVSIEDGGARLLTSEFR